MYNDGFLLSGRKNGNGIEMQFGTYKYIDQSAKRISIGVGFGLIGAVIFSSAFPDYERATYFLMSLKGDDLTQQKAAHLPNDFDALCLKKATLPTVTMTNQILINGRRAILYKDNNGVLTNSTFKRYYMQVEK